MVIASDGKPYADDAVGDLQDVAQRRKKQPPNDRRPLRRKPAGTDRRLQLKPAKLGHGEERDQSSRRRFEGEARGPRDDEAKNGTWGTIVDHVPFEGTAGALSPLQRLEGSTMTLREMEVFRRILNKTAESPTAETGRVSSRLDAAPEFPEALRPLVDEAKDLQAQKAKEMSSKPQQQSASTGAQLAPRAQEYLSSTRKLMDTARTEAALWDVLQTKVFQKVESLQLESRHKPSGGMIRDLNVLTATLPTLLLHFMTLIETSFPRSSLGVMLLPALEKRGPSAFALGATTGLFNHHMSFLYKQYSDLDAIVEILAQMDKNVYNFNSDTRELLAMIFDDADAASSGQAGPALEALWSTDRRQRALTKLRAWDKVVVQRLHADAIRLANEKQVLDEDADEPEELSSQA
ncbi:hypothetical protein TI39_contig402g00020 [Zymoseptoria brevis]|uniref:Mtf2-like C-terminal domain-containing protein n=1 Tax=Zymoseptoria brevis TaxID=1047168 RepID=A0A0F4GNG6_9PEZI|nr:hypothetical protein TI39_contig402g00020 [Zymoseptoria brevis]